MPLGGKIIKQIPYLLWNCCRINFCTTAKRSMAENMAIKKRLSLLVTTLFDKKDELGRNRKNIVIEQFYAGTANTLISNNYLTGLMILLNLNETAIGGVAVLNSLGGVFQAFSFMFLGKYKKKKNIIIFWKAVAYFLNIVLIGCIPFFAFKELSRTISIFTLIFLITFISAIVNPGMSAWHVKSIPQQIRNSYFSFFTVALNVVTFFVTFFSGRIADIFKAGGNELLGLTVLRLIAIVAAVFDLLWLSKIREYPDDDQMGGIRFKMLQIPLTDKNYRYTILVSVLYTFSANITGQYYNLYLLKDMHVPYTAMALVSMCFIITLVLFTPVWSRKIRRTSYFKTLSFLMTLFLVHYIVLSCVTRKTIALYPIGACYSYIFQAGISVIVAGLPFYQIAEDQQINYIGCYATANSVAALIGTEVGTLFITYSHNIKIFILNQSFGNIQLLMLFSAFVMFCSTIWIRTIEKQLQQKRVDQ